MCSIVVNIEERRVNFMEDKVMKIFTVNKFYALFVIIMGYLIINERDILDCAYFVIITFYYIKLKLHQRGII